MKIIEFNNYPDSSIPTWCLHILKFRKRSLIEISVEKQCYKSIPSLLLQIGSDTLLYLSLGLIKFNINLTIWGQHYEW